MGSTSARILTHLCYLTNAQGSQPLMSTLSNVNSDSIPVQTLASQPVFVTERSTPTMNPLSKTFTSHYEKDSKMFY